jgi:hypothetical protein
MDNLEERQREMRKRNSSESKRKQPIATSSIGNLPQESSEVHTLKKHIAKLEKQVPILEAENERLRAQKTIVVERAAQNSSDDSVREQRYNFFKYSNARRY